MSKEKLIAALAKARSLMPTLFSSDSTKERFGTGEGVEHVATVAWVKKYVCDWDGEEDHDFESGGPEVCPWYSCPVSTLRDKVFKLDNKYEWIITEMVTISGKKNMILVPFNKVG